MEKNLENRIIRVLEAIEDKVRDDSEGSVTFKFRENDPGVKLITSRNEMINALAELANYRRSLEKYDLQGEIIVKDNKILIEEELRDYNSDYEGRKTYIEIERVIDKIDEILGDIYPLIYNS